MDIISFPVLISKEGKWFVACCPMLDIATHGRTEEEVTKEVTKIFGDEIEGIIPFGKVEIGFRP